MSNYTYPSQPGSARWRVNFTIYEDKRMGSTRANMANLNEEVTAMSMSVAQSIIEAQYGRDNVQVHGVYPA